MVRLYLKFKNLNDKQTEYTKLHVTSNPEYMSKQFNRVMDIIISFRDEYYKSLDEIDENGTNSFPEMSLKITQFYGLEFAKIHTIYNTYLNYDELLNNFINTHPDKLGLKTFMDL